LCELRGNFSRDIASVRALTFALFVLMYNANAYSCFDACGAEGNSPTYRATASTVID
jgi:hypothetical protein